MACRRNHKSHKSQPTNQPTQKQTASNPQNEDQLLGAQQQGAAPEPEPQQPPGPEEDKSKGIEMDEDFDGALEVCLGGWFAGQVMHAHQFVPPFVFGPFFSLLSPPLYPPCGLNLQLHQKTPCKLPQTAEQRQKHRPQPAPVRTWTWAARGTAAATRRRATATG